MAGGNPNNPKFNKSKHRKPTKNTLFVQGGLLSDWSPPSTGKSNDVNLSGSKGKPGSRFGSGSNGKSKASNSKIVENQKPKMNAFGYNYPQVDPLPDEGGEGSDGHNKLDESPPIVLVDTKESKIVAFVDQTPVMEPEEVKYTYDYSASFEADYSSHRGLGFCDEVEETPNVMETPQVIEKKQNSLSDSSSSHEMDTEVIEDNTSDVEASLSLEKNSGFLSIGGMKLYTHDISDDEEDDEDSEDNEESLASSESGDSSDSSDSDGLYNSDSDVDDEVAKDYFEGIGGSYKVTNVEQLAEQALDSSDSKYDGDISGGRYNDTIEKFEGIVLQEASRKYGMKKPRSSKKSQAKSSKFGAGTDDWSAIDDLMLVKNSRSLYGKKKHVPKLPQSWPSKAEKSKNFRRFPGEKKKQRQDTIALKRRERMIRRGVDLEQINSKLELMVLNKGDIVSFQLMHSRDCSQVQRLAAIYRLRSYSQGSGKRRFVTVTRTEHTSMPSSGDRIRLEKLLGVGNEEADFTVHGAPPGKTPPSRTKKASKGTTVSSPPDPKSAKNKTSGESSKKKRRDKDKTGSYATQPVSFISSGNMVTETGETIIVREDSKPKNQNVNSNQPVACSSSYASFEMHTTGFGSRMMAKMGYIDGDGLGKDGRGIAEPIEAIQRPKSLGLGAKIPETSNTTPVPIYATPPQRLNKPTGRNSRGSEGRTKSGNAQFGSFEKHTKGFGSKMMAKMGFVEGMGLGRDSQGMVDPLVASRLPKSRGLGAKC